MKITTIGVDLAKNVIQVHGRDGRGSTVVKKQLKRDQVLPFFAKLEPCSIGMEACGSAHFWARQLTALGHTVQLMSPQFVKPYVKTNKNDAADAEAICEAVSRPNMRFVPIKTTEQQAVLALHRARSGLVKARTAQANQICGLLHEFGITLPQGIGYIAQRVPAILEDGANGLPGILRKLLDRLFAHLGDLERQVAELEREIQSVHRADDASRRLAEIPGIGPLTASCSLGVNRTGTCIPQRPATGSLDRSCAATTFDGRESHPAWDKQTRRCISTHAIPSRRANGDPPLGTQDGPGKQLAHSSATAAKQKRRYRRARQ